MEYIITFIVCILAIIIVRFSLNIKGKDKKNIVKIGYDKELNDITNKFEDNRKVCQDILEQLRNTHTQIKITEDPKNKLTFYTVITDNIIIADIKDTFTRIQTIAHECLHSVQDKKMLMFNFIFSNIYLIYFIVIIILTLLKIIKQPMIQIFIITVLGFIFYIIRSYLETDAMTKAPYVARKYMENKGILSEEELEKIMNNYNKLNKIGIPMMNYKLMTSVILKIVIYCMILILVNQ